MNLKNMLKYYKGKIFIYWLDELNIHINHGENLVLALGVVGLMDNVYIAEKYLEEAEKEEIIKRNLYSPTANQKFFGIGGLSFEQRKKNNIKSTIEFFWEMGLNYELFLKNFKKFI